MNLKDYILEVKDFPKKWIYFKDISLILQKPEVLSFVIDKLSENIKSVDKIIGLDARWFIFGSLVAYKMKKPFIMLRKKWKLPWECESISYDLEYGKNVFEIQKSAIKNGDKVAIIDDLLATWWSAKAACDLVEKLWWYVDSLHFVIELEFLNWRKIFSNQKLFSLVKY